MKTHQLGFAPVIDDHTRVLVLGSFPSVQSLALGQYYGNPRNHLWSIMSSLTGEDLVSMPYVERLPRLLAHGFGLWDVLGSCERAGSLDAAIREPAANDFTRLRKLCPRLHTIAFNGQAAGKFAAGFDAAGYRTIILPSTSPAHAAMSLAEKTRLWQVLALD